MAYEAPQGNAVNFNFTESGYSAPSGDSILFEFIDSTIISVPVSYLHLIVNSVKYSPVRVLVDSHSFSLLPKTPSITFPQRIVLNAPLLVNILSKAPNLIIPIKLNVPSFSLSFVPLVPLKRIIYPEDRVGVDASTSFSKRDFTLVWSKRGYVLEWSKRDYTVEFN